VNDWVESNAAILVAALAMAVVAIELLRTYFGNRKGRK
jgi:hypothetical protein